MSPNDDFNGDVDVERLDIVTDAKIDAAVADARKAYFQKLVNGKAYLYMRGCVNPTITQPFGEISALQ